ncbi:MAG: rhodanese-like domain-containing protein [Armatimonadota bacterium]|nr:rhodanese-like domain-containing protein [Armatimonadota bacterium]MDR7436970.1 rhodanese-like domain-containing protein [Armatimonadota bacterium]MDR7472256.1 rhodanese-like domain-containing protein [Armatimonadota bacterium]MDR7506785.1 rhodanese-like domain-containing protein [Armatimonadota bacterium]MDR7508345.1 rhodanese-like domain-containing protein [Armatimonadota bacterium]
MTRLALAVLVAVTLASTAPAVAQAPAVQQAVLDYLTNIAADYNAIAAPALKARLDAGEKPFILDVRQPEEFAAGHIPGAVNIPIRTIAQNLGRLPAKDALIVVVCRSGMRAAYVTMALGILGWTNVKDLAFGMYEWERQNFPMEK